MVNAMPVKKILVVDNEEDQLDLTVICKNRLMWRSSGRKLKRCL